MTIARAASAPIHARRVNLFTFCSFIECSISDDPKPHLCDERDPWWDERDFRRVRDVSTSSGVPKPMIAVRHGFQQFIALQERFGTGYPDFESNEPD